MKSNVIKFPQKEKVATRGVIKVPAYCRKLAASLVQTLNICSGNELIRLIGDGDEYSNCRAIESWIRNNYSESDVNAMENPLREIGKALADEIQKRLL